MRGHRQSRKFVILVLWCAGLVVTVPVCARAARDVDAAHFYFAQITDTHWGTADSVNLTRTAVAMMNQLPVPLEFVVHTGDVLADNIGDDRTVREGLEAMKALKAKVYYLPGNHDIPAEDSGNAARLFRQYFGELNSRIEVKGVVCLFACTELLKGDRRSPGRAQREWVEKQLGEGGLPTLIFMHRPPIQDLLAEANAEAWSNESYHPQWSQLFSEHPEVKAMIAGHLHRDELHWIGAVPVHVASSMARFWGRQPSFRLYEYRDGKLGYWTIYIESSTRKPFRNGSVVRKEPVVKKSVKPSQE